MVYYLQPSNQILILLNCNDVLLSTKQKAAYFLKVCYQSECDDDALNLTSITSTSEICMVAMLEPLMAVQRSASSGNRFIPSFK